MDLAFVPGYPANTRRLLGRFLPPLPDGLAAEYVERHAPAGGLVLDPFGQAPQVAVETLHRQRRVIVANFNPVSRLALSLAVRPPTAGELRTALTRLGDMPWGRTPGERLDGYLRGLYLTRCGACGAETQADYFDWEVEAARPLEKGYHCGACGAIRQEAVDEADLALARRYAAAGLDYHLLLDRVAGRDDPDRQHAREALAVYPPRTQAAIAAALVKLDALAPPPETRRLLCGLLIAALDTVCVLAQDRPKILTVPRRYRESSLWLALENAIGTLAGTPSENHAADLAAVLAAPAGPAVYAHNGPVRDLSPHLPPGACSLILSAVPRPNQAYWTLSALWSAWLWGRDSSAALRSVLRRRRYDWSWHATALQAALASVQPTLAPGGRLVAMLAEAEPGFVSGFLAAAEAAGFALETGAVRADTAEAQLVWRAAPPGAGSAALPEADLQAAAAQGAMEALAARCEPSRWLSVHFAGWRALAGRRALAGLADPVAEVNRLLDPVFRGSPRWQRLGADREDDLTTGLWALAEAPAGRSLADRVELEVVRLLAAHPVINEHEVQRLICQAFPGVLTPGRHLVQSCLASYAVRVGGDAWQLRPEDDPQTRADERQAILAELRALAQRHGYSVSGVDPQSWEDDGQPVYQFAVLTTAEVSAYLFGPEPGARKRFLVVPGGRAGLVALKMRRDPRLRAALLDGNWLIVKFRQVRRMAGNPQLTRATLEPAFHEDPLDEARQLALPEEAG